MSWRRPLAITAAGFVLGVLVDVVLVQRPFPGYAASIGLVGCIAIVVVSKWLGKAFIQKREDFWPGDVPPESHPDLASEERALDA